MSTLRYNVKSVLFRRVTALGIIFCIMVAVFVTAATSMLIEGVIRVFTGHGSPGAVIVLAKGTTQEFGSSIPLERARRAMAASGVKTDSNGERLASAENVQLLNLERRDGSGATNVVMRGIDAPGYRLRPSLQIVEGRGATPGTDEGVVGKKIAEEVRGVALGESLRFSGSTTLTIVGVFSDNGSTTESEILASPELVAKGFGVEGHVSEIRALLASPNEFDTFRSAMEEKSIDLAAMRQVDFDEQHARDIRGLVIFIGGVVGFMLSLASILGALVGMHGAVSARIREFGTLRALGFSAGAILRGVMLEVALLSTLGAIAGTLAALALIPVRFSLMGPNWASVVLRFEPSPSAFLYAFLNALVIGFLGAAIPAGRAVRVSPIEALRSR